MRSGPDQAYAYWPRIDKQFSEAEHAYFMVHLADQAARRLNPACLELVYGGGQHQLHPLPYRMRSSGGKPARHCASGDWDLVLETIEAMSTPEQQAGVWRYWKARALKDQGKTTEANAILAPLSTEHNFYGQLAEEDLGVTIGAPAESYKATRKRRLPRSSVGLVFERALALYRLNLRTEAAREWAWAIRDFDDHHLLAAAEVARRNGIYDRAIYTADRTVQHHDFSLRFLAPHRDTLRNILKQQELDEAWVYGLIRQESRFVSDARSSAGAMGLMQLMPATAKWASKKVGVRKFQPTRVTDVNTNLDVRYLLPQACSDPIRQPAAACIRCL